MKDPGFFKIQGGSYSSLSDLANKFPKMMTKDKDHIKKISRAAIALAKREVALDPVKTKELFTKIKGKLDKLENKKISRLRELFRKVFSPRSKMLKALEHEISHRKKRIEKLTYELFKFAEPFQFEKVKEIIGNDHILLIEALDVLIKNGGLSIDTKTAKRANDKMRELRDLTALEPPPNHAKLEEILKKLHHKKEALGVLSEADRVKAFHKNPAKTALALAVINMLKPPSFVESFNLLDQFSDPAAKKLKEDLLHWSRRGGAFPTDLKTFIFPNIKSKNIPERLKAIESIFYALLKGQKNEEAHLLRNARMRAIS